MTRALAVIVSTFTLAFAMLVPARAEPVPQADAAAIRAVVEAQLDAFAADDAKRAFSYAAPAIRSMFETPERFIAMVRAGYPAVYRPASVAFLVPDREAGEVVQTVHLTDRAGDAWLAVYRLERQPDRSWRIAGCELQRVAGKLT